MKKTLAAVVLALTTACGGQQLEIPLPAPVLPAAAKMMPKEFLEQIASEKEKFNPEVETFEEEITPWQDKLESIYDSVICLRSIRVYSDGESWKVRYFHGTGLPIFRDGDSVYIATNEHVVISDKNTRYKGKSLPLFKTELSVIKETAPYLEQNLPLKVLNSINGRIDTAVLLGIDDERLLVSKDYVVDPEIDIRLGDEVFSIGCLRSSEKVVNYGHIANVDYQSTDGKSILANLSITHGQSGGPVFLRREDEVYLIGHVRSYPNKDGGTAYSIMTSIKDLYPIWYQEQ